MTLQGNARSAIYWILTLLIGLSQFASGVMDLLQFEPIVKGVTDLGYPAYILFILGPAKIIGATIILVPRLPLLKEWAYAGFVIDFFGAFLSHTFHGDGIELRIPPLLALCILLGSYFLRAEPRKLPSA